MTLDDLYLHTGNTHYNAQDYAGAIEYYTQGINVDPNYTQAYNNRGRAYCIQNKLDQALRDYNQAIALDPNYAEAYYNRGLLLELANTC